MINIKNLEVKVAYKVGLVDLNVSKEVLEELNKINQKGIELDSSDENYPYAIQWLRDNIKERDCFDAQYEIIELD